MGKCVRGVRNRATTETGKRNSAMVKRNISVDEGDIKGTKRIRTFGSSSLSAGNGVVRSITRSIGGGGGYGKSVGFTEFRDRKESLLKSLRDDIAVLDKQIQCDITGYSQYPVVVCKNCTDAMARARARTNRLKEEGGVNGRLSSKGIRALKIAKELEDEAEKLSSDFRSMISSMESFAKETCASTERRLDEMIQCH